MTVGYLKTQGGGACVAKGKQVYAFGVWDQNKPMNKDGKKSNQNQGDCATAVENFVKMMLSAGY